MKIRNTITKFCTLTIAVAALAVIGYIGAPGRASAAGQTPLSDGSIRFFSNSVGLVPEQTLRFSAANLSPEEEGIGAVRAQVTLYDTLGNVLARSREVEVPACQFRTVDFKCEDLSAVGEPNTGRIQVRGVVQVAFSDGSVRHLPEQFPISVELMDARTGGTVVNSGGDYYTGTVTVSGD